VLQHLDGPVDSAQLVNQWRWNASLPIHTRPCASGSIFSTLVLRPAATRWRKPP